MGCAVVSKASVDSLSLCGVPIIQGQNKKRNCTKPGLSPHFCTMFVKLICQEINLHMLYIIMISWLSYCVVIYIPIYCMILFHKGISLQCTMNDTLEGIIEGLCSNALVSSYNDSYLFKFSDFASNISHFDLAVLHCSHVV